MCKKQNNIVKRINGKIFLSYCTDDKPVVELIKKIITEKDKTIEISEYTEVKYKESFIKFMNSIQEHQFALCIVSDGYLKSQNCMYEVGEFITRDDFKERLLFVVLSALDTEIYSKDTINLRRELIDYKVKVANIYNGFNSKIEYMLYWQGVYESQKKELKKLRSIKARMKLKKDLEKTKRIYKKDIPIFIDYLSDYNGKTFRELYNNKFKDILSYISVNRFNDTLKDCKSFKDLFRKTMLAICEITKTDYNQIALCLKTSKHHLGLVVVANKIPSNKQKYRFVDYGGFMGMAYVEGETKNIADVRCTERYFCAVRQTKSEIVVPIKILGKVVGVFNSESEVLDHYCAGNKDSNIESDLESLSAAFAKKLMSLGYVSTFPYDDMPYIDMS